jgi:hypothetical protein
MSTSNVFDNTTEIKNARECPEIELVDVDDKYDLTMYSYKEGVTEKSAEEVRNCRGVVYAGDKVVMRTFGYTPEYFDNDDGKLREILSGVSLEDCYVFDSREGALIRVFFHTDKWFVCTHRKLDAYRSRWSSRDSFGEMFESAINYLYDSDADFAANLGEVNRDESKVLDRFFEKLDKGCSHTFLVSNTESNRIVCEAPPVPCVNYVGSFSPDGTEFIFFNTHVPTPVRYETTSIEQLIDQVKAVDPRRSQGVMVVCPTGYFKITSSNYKRLYDLRNNCSSVKFRYLQLRSDKALLEAFVQLYPAHVEYFREYETIISIIAKNIHQAYINRFIKKQYTVVSPDEYSVIKVCHGKHIENREFKVTEERVYEALNSCSAVMLNRMIKNFKDPKPVLPVTPQ